MALLCSAAGCWRLGRWRVADQLRSRARTAGTGYPGSRLEPSSPSSFSSGARAPSSLCVLGAVCCWLPLLAAAAAVCCRHCRLCAHPPGTPACSTADQSVPIVMTLGGVHGNEPKSRQGGVWLRDYFRRTPDRCLGTGMTGYCLGLCC
jgi:hypothetical protein